MSLCMLDIGQAIRRMEQASSGYVFLYWFAGLPSWDLHPLKLWPAMHGGEYHPMPKSDVLYNVLYEMGIYPNMEAFPFHKNTRFASMDEAAAYLGPRYQVNSREKERLLLRYLEGVLEEDGDFLELRHNAVCVKMWWKKEGLTC